MKYKVGDTVRIRKDLKVGKKYGTKTIVETMQKHLGKEANIIYVYKKEVCYNLDIDDGYCAWTPEMFEKPKPKDIALNSIKPQQTIKEHIDELVTKGVRKKLKELKPKVSRQAVREILEKYKYGLNEYTTDYTVNAIMKLIK